MLRQNKLFIECLQVKKKVNVPGIESHSDHSFFYRVSLSKASKVILLWWGYRFWFMLIFWFLWVHGIGAFMPNSSVFIFLMLRAPYGSITQHLLFLNEMWTILIFRCLFQVIKSNKPSKILFFFKLKVFWWNEAVEVIEATEVVEVVEVIEAI